jgi:hypothetical protein
MLLESAPTQFIAAEPSRANAIRCLRSSALRKRPRIMPHPNPPIRKRQGPTLQ